MKVLREQGFVYREVILGIRPEDFHEVPVSIEASVGTKISVKIDVAELMGSETMLYAQIDGQNFVARVDARTDVRPEQQVESGIDMNKVHFFELNTEIRLPLEAEYETKRTISSSDIKELVGAY